MSKVRRAAIKSNQEQSARKQSPGQDKGQKGSEREKAPGGRPWGLLAVSAGAFLLAVAVYALRLDRVVGSTYVDDAYYVMLAKALATGQGYMLLNTPSPGIVPIYPPVFPALLSVAFRISPQFPNNLWLLKSVSIVAMLGAGFLTWVYFRRERGTTAVLALGVAVATVLNPGIVGLVTTSVMSEPVFLFFLMLTLFLIERGVRLSKGKESSEEPLRLL
ncbi:MAG TPA: hypothetical protein VFD58_18440 [Blastocatellia bacterium]|nr:hypothetical protein [Blastocatellia bacterium]